MQRNRRFRLAHFFYESLPVLLHDNVTVRVKLVLCSFAVALPIALLPLLLDDLSIIFQLLLFDAAVALALVHFDVEPLYVNFPVTFTYHSTSPDLFLYDVFFYPVLVFAVDMIPESPFSLSFTVMTVS